MSIPRCPRVRRILPVIRWLLYRTKMGLDDNLAYADALTLIERGADPNRAAADGMTLAEILTQHRAHFARTLRTPPEFAALWD